jgi:hypothetical protein
MVEEFLDSILKFQPKDPTQRLWPALIGPTGSAKTTHVRNYAQKEGYNYVCLLLGTGLPEDILGLPIVRDDEQSGSSVTKYTQRTVPDWARTAIDARSIIHVDEIDKARPESIACILTLLASKEVHGIPLHPETIIVVSGQPVPSWWLDDESGRALAARLVWMQTRYDHLYLERKHRRNLAWLPTIDACAMPVLPVPSVRQVDWLYSFAKHKEQDVAMIETAARGVLPSGLVMEFMKSIGEVYEGLEREDAYDGYFELPIDKIAEYVMSITPAECTTLVERGFTATHPRYLFAPMLRITWSDDKDLLEETLKKFHAVMSTAADNNLEVWNDVDVETEIETGGLWSQKRPRDAKKALKEYCKGQRPKN